MPTVTPLLAAQTQTHTHIIHVLRPEAVAASKVKNKSIKNPTRNTSTALAGHKEETTLLVPPPASLWRQRVRNNAAATDVDAMDGANDDGVAGRRNLLKVSQRGAVAAAAAGRATAARVAFDVRADDDDIGSDDNDVHRPAITSTTKTKKAATSRTVANSNATIAAIGTMRRYGSPAQIVLLHGGRPRGVDAATPLFGGGRKSLQRFCGTLQQEQEQQKGLRSAWSRWWWWSSSPSSSPPLGLQRLASSNRALRTDEARQIRTDSSASTHVGAVAIAVADDDKMARRPMDSSDAAAGLPDRITTTTATTPNCCSMTMMTAVGRALRRVGAHLNEFNFSRSTIQFLGAMCQQGM